MLWKTDRQYFQKLNTHLPYNLTIPLSQRDLKAYVQPKININIHNRQILKTTQVSINKVWDIHTMNYYSAIKKNELLFHSTMQINLKIIHIEEKDQKVYKETSGCDRYVHYLDYDIDLKYKPIELYILNMFSLLCISHHSKTLF